MSSNSKAKLQKQNMTLGQPHFKNIVHKLQSASHTKYTTERRS